MEYWRGKVAVVTGAGGGIGAQITEDLIKSGMTVIGLDYTDEKIQAMGNKLEELKQFSGQLIPYKCDISVDAEVENAFSGIVELHGGVDVLVNNAVTVTEDFISTGSLELFKKSIDTNIYGLVACTRLAIKSMSERGLRGHIVNINSICGHYVPPLPEPKLNMYAVSKRAMTALSDVLRHEFSFLKLNIKVSNISPGNVATEICKAAGCTAVISDFMDSSPRLQPADVSAAVLGVLAAPAHVLIHEVTMYALHERL